MASHEHHTDDSSKPKTATIKIAAKDSSMRPAGSADPGPGDPNAEPSRVPEVMSIPQAPTASQLVVKSSNSRVIKTINDPLSLPKNSHLSASGGHSHHALGSHSGRASGVSAARSEGAPREPTSSKALSGYTDPSTVPQGFVGVSAGVASAAHESSTPRAEGSAAPDSPTQSGSTARFTVKSAGSMGVAGRTASAAMQANSQSPGMGGSEHDEVEEGEGEIEQPQDSPRTGMAATASGSAASGGVDTAPASSGGGASKMSPKTSARLAKSDGRSKSNKSQKTASDGEVSDTSASDTGKNKKVTKFRYHKRITVRTHGKTSPSTIIEKVNKKDHKQGITPSTIEDMDPQELMKRAGIKGKKGSHWRVRLRQTKRMTKNGKTVTQTKVAYRDSDGNKKVKTVLGPNCKKCGKKSEECKCDEP